MNTPFEFFPVFLLVVWAVLSAPLLLDSVVTALKPRPFKTTLKERLAEAWANACMTVRKFFTGIKDYTVGKAYASARLVRLLGITTVAMLRDVRTNIFIYITGFFLWLSFWSAGLCPREVLSRLQHVASYNTPT